MTLGERIREARDARGWSQGELAKRCGLSRPTIARIEGGQHVRMVTLEKVAKALGLAVALGKDADQAGEGSHAQ